MSPLKIQMLLHFYCCPEPFPNVDAPAQKEAIKEFARDELIVADPSILSYALTERGRAYVSMLCTLPLPVANWTIPGPWNPSFPSERP